jgi:hypothetical protein
LERLTQVERSFNDFHETGLNKIFKRYISNIFSLLPTAVLKSALESDPGLQLGFAALLGAKEAYKLDGKPVLSIHPLLGPSFSTMGKIIN